MKNTKRILFVLLLQLFSTTAFAAIWSDVWWNPNESGWGVNVSQQGGVMFLTFFLYAPDTTPKWYTAAVYRGARQSNGYEQFSGDVYETRGPWLGGVFSPSAVQAARVGSVTFAPLTPYSANLFYSIDGINVTKSIQRQTWQHINLTGGYYGGYAVERSTCPDVPVGSAGTLELHLAANVAADGVSGNLASTLYIDGSGACLLSGTYRQYGSVYNVVNAALCGLGALQINVSDFSKTDEGVDGNLLFRTSTCSVGARFSAVQFQ